MASRVATEIGIKCNRLNPSFALLLKCERHLLRHNLFIYIEADRTYFYLVLFLTLLFLLLLLLIFPLLLLPRIPPCASVPAWMRARGIPSCRMTFRCPGDVRRQRQSILKAMLAFGDRPLIARNWSDSLSAICKCQCQCQYHWLSAIPLSNSFKDEKSEKRFMVSPCPISFFFIKIPINRGMTTISRLDAQ